MIRQTLGISILITLALLISTEAIQVHGASNNQTTIPEWVRGIAGLWADGLIDDAAFAQAISFLIEQGIIVIGEPEEVEPIQTVTPEPELQQFDKATAVTDGSSFKKGDTITVNGRISSIDPLPDTRLSFDTNEVELQKSTLLIRILIESAGITGYSPVTSHYCEIDNETYHVTEDDLCASIKNLKINKDTTFIFDVAVDTTAFEDYGTHKIRIYLTSHANDGERVYHHWVTTNLFTITQ